MDREDNLCEWCGDHPVCEIAIAHGYHICEDCASLTVCDECETECFKPGYVWDATLCDECRAKHERETVTEEACAASERIAQVARELGYDVQEKGSDSSESRYCLISRDNVEYRIRIAAHTARPTWQHLYGDADYEVAVGAGHPDMDGRVDDCIAWIKTV